MKHSIFKFYFLVLTVSFLVSCQTRENQVVVNDIQFDSVQVDKTYHLLDVETNPGCSLRMTFVYPVEYQDKAILRKIQSQFISGCLGDEFISFSPKEAVEKYADHFVNAFKAEENDFLADRENHLTEPDDSWYAIEEETRNEILFNQMNLLSVVITKSYYNGGAHNSNNYLNRVIHLKTGNRITENEIFIDDYKEDLSTILVEAITLSNNLENPADLENMGFFNVAEIHPNKNFYVDEIGLTYTFNEYEIAAFAVGTTVVQLPFEKIRHLLRKESPIVTIAFRE